MKAFQWTGLALLCFMSGAHALQPFINENGWLLFRAEDGKIRKTQFMAVVCGVETWYSTWEYLIDFYLSEGPYTYPLPNGDGTWTGRATVNAESLTRLIWNTSWIDLGDIPEEPTRELIVRAIEEDRSKTSLHEYHDINEDYWDPYPYWKWRSVFMEDRFKSNWDWRARIGNCWGTADYLIRGYEWTFPYDENKVEYRPATDPKAKHEDMRTFPEINLDGWEYQNDYSFDHELLNIATYEGKSGFGEIPDYLLLNAFDVIRFDDDSANYKWNLMWDADNYCGRETDLGMNVHAAVYLCRDSDNVIWTYEKGSDGITYFYPHWDPHDGVIGALYGINSCLDGSVTTGSCRNNYHKSYFKIPGDVKLLLADSYEMDWAGVETEAGTGSDTDCGVTRFILINTDTNRPIRYLKTSTDTVNVSVEGQNLNVVADIFGRAQSVVFELTGNPNHTEYSWPYALKGDDTAGNYFAWTPADGRYVIKATPYKGHDGQGEACQSLETSIDVVRSIARGASSTHCGVSGFILIDADTNKPIRALKIPNDTINVKTDGKNLNVRADVVGPIQSIVFELTGSADHIENGTPYALKGDTNGDYFAWTPAAGTYLMRARPYKGLKGKGEACDELHMTMVVI